MADTIPMIPTHRAPMDPPPTPEERLKKNRILVAGYLGLHLLVFLLPLPGAFMLSIALIAMNVNVGYRASHLIDSRLREESYMRNLRLLNPFHYRPDLEDKIVNAFVELIAPETEEELHGD